MRKINVTNDMRRRHEEYYENQIVPRFLEKYEFKDGDGKLKQEITDVHNDFMGFCWTHWREIATGTPEELRNLYKEIEVYHPKIGQFIKQKEKIKMNQLEEKKSYKDHLLQIFGYDNFREEINVYTRLEKAAEKKLSGTKKSKKAIAKEKREKMIELACQLNPVNVKLINEHNISPALTDKAFKKAFKEHLNLDVTLLNYKMVFEHADWGAYSFLLATGVKTCPYCNRQYILPIYSNNGKARAQIDHFFPKSSYPYFSLSLYNLIPSCSVCNASLKRKEEFTPNTLNPYEVDFHKLARFKVIPYKDQYIISLKARKDEKCDEEQVNQQKQMFKLESRYSYQQQVIEEMVKRRMIYNEDYIDSLLKKYPMLFQSKEQIWALGIGYEVEEDKICDEPLGKLKRDVAEQLDRDEEKLERKLMERLKKIRF